MLRKTTQRQIVADPDFLNLSEYYWLDKRHVMAICPYHNDTNPSLAVNLVDNVFYCFSCKESGTLTKLAKITEGSVSRRRVSRNGYGVTNLDNNEWRNLLKGEPAFDNEYLMQRGVTNEQIDEFNILSFQSGIVFPVMDKNNHHTIGALIRFTNNPNKQARYMKLGNMAPLWPINYMYRGPIANSSPAYIDKSGRFKNAVLVEGVFSALRGMQAGVPTFATFGTVVTNQLIAELNGFSKVTVACDPDFAGYVAAARVVHSVPHAHVIVPGQEWDEMPASEWYDMYANGWATTRNIRQLARISGEQDKFYKRLHLNNNI